MGITTQSGQVAARKHEGVARSRIGGDNAMRKSARAQCDRQGDGEADPVKFAAQDSLHAAIVRQPGAGETIDDVAPTAAGHRALRASISRATRQISRAARQVAFFAFPGTAEGRGLR